MSDGSFSLNVPQRDEFAEKLLQQLRRLLGDYGLERRRDGRSLDAYANGARPDYAALVAKVSPESFWQFAKDWNQTEKWWRRRESNWAANTPNSLANPKTPRVRYPQMYPQAANPSHGRNSR